MSWRACRTNFTAPRACTRTPLALARLPWRIELSAATYALCFLSCTGCQRAAQTRQQRPPWAARAAALALAARAAALALAARAAARAAARVAAVALAAWSVARAPTSLAMALAWAPLAALVARAAAAQASPARGGHDLFIAPGTNYYALPDAGAAAAAAHAAASAAAAAASAAASGPRQQLPAARALAASALALGRGGTPFAR